MSSWGDIKKAGKRAVKAVSTFGFSEVKEYEHKANREAVAAADAANQQARAAELEAIRSESANAGEKNLERKRKARAATLLATSPIQSPQTTLLGG